MPCPGNDPAYLASDDLGNILDHNDLNSTSLFDGYTESLYIVERGLGHLLIMPSDFEIGSPIMKIEGNLLSDEGILTHDTHVDCVVCTGDELPHMPK